MEDLKTNLRREFGASLDDASVMDSCLDICRAFNLNAETLRYKWEAMTFGVPGKASAQLDAENAIALRAHIKRELDTQVELANKRRAAKSGPARTGKLFGAGGPSIQLNTRKDRVVKTEPGISNGADASSNFSTSVQLHITNSNRTAPYRYMFEKLTERSDVLDTRLDKFAELVREFYNIEELGDGASITEEEIVVVGRVVSDSDAKLNETSLMLECSRMLGNGSRTALRFDPALRSKDDSTGIYLFPGMILAVRGRNGGGEWFSVSEVLNLPDPSPKPSMRSGLSDSFSVVIASGPFTPDGDAELRFKPLISLLSKIKDNPPSVLLLTGPIIDASHPSIRNGDLSRDIKTVFRESISRPLRAFLQRCPNTKIALVASTKDILNSHFVFPQAAMDTEQLDIPHGVVVLPNPCGVEINGVSIGVATTDILFHLRRHAIEKRFNLGASSTENRDPMGDLCRHLIRQRSFYPMFPVPEEFSHDVNLDVSHSDMLDFEHVFESANCRPQILILPSMFKQFHKVVGDVLFVNPPSLAKGQMFTRLTYDSRQASVDEQFSVTFEPIAQQQADS